MIIPVPTLRGSASFPGDLLHRTEPVDAGFGHVGDFDARCTSGHVTRNTTTTSRIVVRPRVNAKPCTCPTARTYSTARRGR